MSRSTTPLRATSFDQTLDVEIPEQVLVSYTIAGLGSRAAAAMIDFLVCLSGFIVLTIGLMLILPGPLTFVAAGSMTGAWAVALLYIAQFAMIWGYYVLCEALADGRTLGKRALGLRVVHDEGFSISFAGSAIRNLFRIVDLQPGILGTVGLVSIALSRRGKRIGDSAAGTIVVRERPLTHTHRMPEPAVAEQSVGDPVLNDAEFDLLNRYVQRRVSIPPAERARLGTRLAQRLRPHLGGTGNDAAELMRLYARERSLRAKGAASRSDTGAARERHALVAHGSERWMAFATALGRARRVSLKRMSEDEVREFVAQYREISSDLARLRTASRQRTLDDVFYLSRLVAAGHNLLYRRERMAAADTLRFMSSEVPAEVRRSWRHLAVAAVFLFLPWIIAHAGVVRVPQSAAEFLPGSIIEAAEQARTRADGRYVDVPEVFRPVMATSIIANNVQVSIAAFAFGITAGIGTICLLVSNGIMLGGVTGVYDSKGVFPTVLSFVAPHGVLELAAIVIAGAAGLLLASALILPGPRTRRDALIENGRRAIALMAGVVLLLIVAGLIEGLVSPAHWPLRDKVGVSLASGLALLLYLIPTRSRAPSRPDRR